MFKLYYILYIALYIIIIMFLVIKYFNNYNIAPICLYP